jgi:AcrR family transcriptional regulator
VARRGVEHIAERLATVDIEGSPTERLAHTVRAGGQAVIDDLDAIMVFLRDGRHLSAEHRHNLRARSRANDDLMIDAIRGARPQLSRRHAGFMLQSLSGMYLSIAHFHPGVSRSRIEDIWTVMGTAALLCAPDVSITVGRTPLAAASGASRASRREGILGEATNLFRRHGFGGVSVDDIGAAAGIGGPALYRYFENKEELLAAAISRAGEQLAASASTALAAADDASALQALIGSYVHIAITQADTIAVYLAEVDSLGEDRRRSVRRDQRGYVDEWRAVVQRLAPDLALDDARVAVHAAIGMANGYAQGNVRPPIEAAAAVLTGMMSTALSSFTRSSPA